MASAEVPQENKTGPEEHEELTYPSEEEVSTLRRVSDTIPWNVYLVTIIDLSERFSHFGAISAFTNFIQQPLPQGSRTGAGFVKNVSGALGLGQRMSTRFAALYLFWSFLTPLYGAYLADTYWGRYKTICFAVAIAIIGRVILIVAAIPGVINHRFASLACFIISLIVTGFEAAFRLLLPSNIQIGNFSLGS